MNEKEISFRTTDTNEAYVAGVKRGTGGGRESGDGGGSVVCVFLLPTPSLVQEEPCDLCCHVEYLSRSDVFEFIRSPGFAEIKETLYQRH